MPSPRTVFVHSSDEMYGADRMLLESLAALPDAVREGTEVWLPSDIQHGPRPLCHELTRREIAWRHKDLPILRRRNLSPSGLTRLAGRVRNLRAELRNDPPAVVVLTTSAVLPSVAAMPKSTRSVLYLQEIWGPKERSVLGILAARVNRIVAISEAARASLPRRVRSLSTVVANGTVAPAYFELPELGTAPLRYVVASRWNSWKGHEFLLSAWDQAESAGDLIVLGSPPELGAAVDVADIVAGMSRRDSVQVVGETPDVGDYLTEADVVLVPSIQPEPFGLVTIEAFARARPVIATNHGGSVELVQDGAGWLVEPNAVEELASLFNRLSRTDVRVAGAKARERFEQSYSISAYRERFWAAVQDLF